MEKVLYVEDDQINAFLMKRYLKDYELVWVPDAEACLEVCKEQVFKLVLLDINLGESKMTGIEAMQELKKLPTYANSLMVAVTAYAMPEDKARFLAEGFDEYFAKPVDFDKLVEYVNNVFKG